MTDECTKGNRWVKPKRELQHVDTQSGLISDFPQLETWACCDIGCYFTYWELAGKQVVKVLSCCVCAVCNHFKYELLTEVNAWTPAAEPLLNFTDAAWNTLFTCSSSCFNLVKQFLVSAFPFCSLVRSVYFSYISDFSISFSGSKAFDLHTVFTDQVRKSWLFFRQPLLCVFVLLCVCVNGFSVTTLVSVSPCLSPCCSARLSFY